ncbi:GAF domain-containing sensor histidine kinase [Halorubrum salinum]|uniref:GAF domain-containing sensor histidine kinase n=1 Tax=Halorubrum salinum TaxID=767517 RepID=UPI00211159A6|nr:GAF domain-containing protein [Halorubrum salinum]
MTSEESADAAGPSDGAPSDRFKSVVETMTDGVFVLNDDDTITYVNAAIESFVGIDRETLVGATFDRLVDVRAIDAGEYDRFVEALEILREGTQREYRMTVETTSGSKLELRLCGRQGSGGGNGVVGTVRDVTDRERALETLERQQVALYRLYQADVNTELSAEEKIEQALEVGCEFLDLPIGYLSSVDGETQRFDRVVGFDGLENTSMPLKSSYCRLTVTSDDPVAIQDAETDLGADDPTYVESGISCYIGTKVPVNGALHGTFCFAAADARDRSFSPNEREFVRLLGLWAGHNLERQRTERVLRRLHEVSENLMLAESKLAVAQIAVDAAAELFDLPITACWQYDEATDSLQPLAATENARELIEETPVFERGEALVWESFDTKEVRWYEDLADETDPHNPDTPLRSEIHIPLGHRGVIVNGATEPRTFEGIDIESLTLLGELVTNALINVDQQESLARRGEALQRQNKQLEEFAHLVAHDLRNPLAGAVGFLEIARETHESAHFDRVKNSHNRMQGLINELLDIARGQRTAVEPRTLSVASVVTEAWSYVDAPEATLSIAGDLGQIDADETRLLQLFGNLFRNSVEHAGSEVDVEVGPLDAGGFYVVDDGPGLPEGARDDVLKLGKTRSAKGTGIGLSSVTDIIEAHGWELAIPNTAGGARFEIRTDGATGTTTSMPETEG